MIGHALRFTRQSFVAGHLDWVGIVTGTPLRLIVSQPKERARICRKRPALTHIQCQPVTLILVERLLKAGSVIALIDAYALWKTIHYPHYIIISAHGSFGFKVFDPWNGARKWVESKDLMDAIAAVDRLGFGRQLITLDLSTSRSSSLVAA